MAFYGIPMFGEGLVSKTLDNTIKGKGASVAQQQLNRGLQQTRRGMMGQAAADRSNPALAVRNAMLAGSQAATDTNMQAAQLRAQEQATALGQRMAQGQQQGQQFFGQLGAIGKGLAASGVLSPDASAAVGAMSGLAPGQRAAQPGGNISTTQRVTQPLMNPGLLGQPRIPADNIAARLFNAKPPVTVPAPAQGGNTSTSAPAAPQMSPELAAIYNAAVTRSGAPSGEMVQVPAQQAANPEMAAIYEAAGARAAQPDARQAAAPPQTQPASAPQAPVSGPGPANPPPPVGNIQMVRGIATVPMGDGRFRAVPNPNYQAPAAQSPAQAVLAGQPQPQPQASSSGANPDELRRDGSRKGRGYLGPVRRDDGRDMTEFTVGVNIDGQEMDIPTLVPGLSPSEIEYLRTSNDGDQRIWDTPTGQSILSRAEDHARSRLSSGRSVFYEDGVDGNAATAQGGNTSTPSQAEQASAIYNQADSYITENLGNEVTSALDRGRQVGMQPVSAPRSRAPRARAEVPVRRTATQSTAAPKLDMFSPKLPEELANESITSEDIDAYLRATGGR
jgi:hypothetical protein